MTDAGFRRLTLGLVLLGTALRAWQYAAGATFWLDEIAIARGYLEELDAFRGRRRLWLLLTMEAGPYREYETIVAFLDRTGRRLDAVYRPAHPVPPGVPPWWITSRNASVYLYDLSGTNGERC